MKRLSASVATATASGFALAALAQAPAPPPDRGPQPEQPRVPAPQQQQTVDVSDQELDTFTTIYVEVRAIAEEYEGRMASAEDPQQAQELQGEMQEESLEAIEDHGWTQQQYAQTARAINGDQSLLEEAMALIQEKS